MNTKNGCFLAHDAHGSSLLLNWEEIPGHTEQLNDKIKSLTNIFVSAYTKTEVEFARKKPEDITNDFMLKSLSSLVAQGVDKTDWQLFEKQTAEILQQFFMNTDWAKYSGHQDKHIFVTVHDQTGAPLGALQFFTTPDFESGHIKAALFGVLPAANNRRIEKVLMAAIFKLRPSLKRIFLETRTTNERAIALYESWGFTRFAGKLPNWANLEYFADKSDVLQKVVERVAVSE